MRKYFILVSFLMILFNSSFLKASIMDELNYINEKSDLYSYINFSQAMSFLNARGVDINEFDSMIMSGPDNDTDKLIKKFGLQLTDINEFLMVTNTGEIDKKTGYLIFISFKNSKGQIPDDFTRNSVKLKSGIAYRASVEDDVLFTRIDDFFVIGSPDYLDYFMMNRSSKKISLSARSSLFIKKVAGKSIYLNITISDYLKTLINNSMNANTVMARGLKDNVFIQTILSLEFMDFGIDLNEKIIIQSEMQGAKPEDSERLQMICHTWIVGSSLVLSFADLMAAQSNNKNLSELSSDQQLMAWMQRAFGRIHVKQVDKGVTLTFEMTSSEADVMIAFIKKEMEKEKKERAERIEREKISKLTLAISDNNMDEVNRFIKEKYNLDGFDTDGNTPLGIAAMAGNVKIARLLIEKGAGVNVPNIDRIMPLHLAVKIENRDMITLLLGKGADVNAKGETDLTPLHYNAMQGNSEITRILIVKGAQVNAVDADLSTPLHYAALSGLLDIVKVLIEKKADPNMVNSAGQRAIDVAALNNQTAVVEFFKTKLKQQPKDFTIEEKEQYNSDDQYNPESDSAPIDNGSVFEEDIE